MNDATGGVPNRNEVELASLTLDVSPDRGSGQARRFSSTVTVEGTANGSTSTSTGTGTDPYQGTCLYAIACTYSICFETLITFQCDSHCDTHDFTPVVIKYVCG
jgi:hypothetical protein